MTPRLVWVDGCGGGCAHSQDHMNHHLDTAFEWHSGQLLVQQRGTDWIGAVKLDRLSTSTSAKASGLSAYRSFKLSTPIKQISAFFRS